MIPAAFYVALPEEPMFQNCRVGDGYGRAAELIDEDLE